jgi:hypothetical protein
MSRSDAVCRVAATVVVSVLLLAIDSTRKHIKKTKQVDPPAPKIAAPEPPAKLLPPSAASPRDTTEYSVAIMPLEFVVLAHGDREHEERERLEELQSFQTEAAFGASKPGGRRSARKASSKGGGQKRKRKNGELAGTLFRVWRIS